MVELKQKVEDVKQGVGERATASGAVEAKVIDPELATAIEKVIQMRKTRSAIEKEEKALKSYIKERAEVMLEELEADKLLVRESGERYLTVRINSIVRQDLDQNKLLQHLTIDQLQDCKVPKQYERLELDVA